MQEHNMEEHNTKEVMGQLQRNYHIGYFDHTEINQAFAYTHKQNP